MGNNNGIHRTRGGVLVPEQAQRQLEEERAAMIDPFLQELAKEVTVFQMGLDLVVKESLRDVLRGGAPIPVGTDAEKLVRESVPLADAIAKAKMAHLYEGIREIARLKGAGDLPEGLRWAAKRAGVDLDTIETQ